MSRKARDQETDHEMAGEERMKGALTEIQNALVRGIADADAERLKPAKVIFDRLEAKYRAMVVRRVEE